MNSTPYLPALRHQLGRFASTLSALQNAPLPQLQLLLSSLLPAHLLSANDDGAHSRERIFSLRRVFFAFLWQVLNPTAACREALRQLQAEARLLGASLSDSDDTSAYCQARQRLPRERLEQIYRHTALLAEQRIRDGQLWLGRVIKVVDGTTFSMPDTAENQALYPQESQQKPGCGFPLIRFVGVLSLASGALLDHLTSSRRAHDIQLFDRLRESFRPGDVVLGDRGFSSYAQIGLLSQAGVDSVFRLHQGRPETPGHRSSFPAVQKLGRREWLVRWTKPGGKPAYMSQRDWERVPESLTVRIIKSSIRSSRVRTRKVILVTTLLESKKYSALQLAALYRERWQIELTFRNLKAVLQMDVLRCKSPEMIQKEILMHFIAYNLIRLLMQEAAIVGSVPLERISFKGALDTFRQYVTAMGTKRAQKRVRAIYRTLVGAIARGQVPYRPGRREPRAVKRRPKRHQLLTAPRHQFREYRHRGKYPNRAWA
jgi:hypothetical protein